MTAHTCPACGRPIDPLRAGSVAILGGTFRYFCDQGCKASHLSGSAFTDRTEAPPQVVMKKAPEPKAVLLPPAPKAAVPALAAESEAHVAALPDAPDMADLDAERPFGEAMRASREPPLPIALFGIAIALLSVLLALLGSRMMAVRLPLVVLSALTTLGFLGLSGTARARPLTLLVAQVLPVGIVPILATLSEFAKKPEHPLLLVSADAMATLAGFVSLSVLTTELCARTLEGRLKREISQLSTKLPEVARLVQDTTEMMVPVSDVQPGAIVRCHEGERVPLDGTIVAKTESDRSVVRATTIPIEVAIKDEVLAGFVLEHGSIDIRTGNAGPRRWLSVIADRANGAPEGQGAAVRSVGLALGRSGEAMLARLVPAGLVVAALAYAAAAFAIGARGVELMGAAAAGFSCVSVTALLVSVRLSTRYGFLRAWQAGVTFQDSASFARLGVVDTAVICGSDGILCDDPLVVAVEVPAAPGRAKSSEVPAAPGRAKSAPGRAKSSEVPAAGERAGRDRAGRTKATSSAPTMGVRGSDRLLALAGSAEAYVGDDPTASAIRAVFKERGLSVQPLRSCEVLPGLGVVGVLATGERLVVGSHALFLQERISVAGTSGGALPSGRKNMYVALDGRLQGTIVLDAVPRVVAAVAMQRILVHRVEPVLLSHESRDVAESVASAVCIEHVRACATADEALAEVDALVEVGRITAVVGFPERDEALFERGHIGIAMRGCGLPFREWSVATMSSDPRTITAAFEESSRLRDAHRRSLAIALAPGGVALFAALFGLVPIYLPALFAMVGGGVALYRASVR